MLEGELRK
jgi:hypothetical protein